MGPKKIPSIKRSLNFLTEEVSAVRLQQRNILDLVEEDNIILSKAKYGCYVKVIKLASLLHCDFFCGATRKNLPPYSVYFLSSGS